MPAGYEFLYAALTAAITHKLRRRDFVAFTGKLAAMLRMGGLDTATALEALVDSPNLEQAGEIFKRNPGLLEESIKDFERAAEALEIAVPGSRTARLTLERMFHGFARYLTSARDHRSIREEVDRIPLPYRTPYEKDPGIQAATVRPRMGRLLKVLGRLSELPALSADSNAYRPSG